MGSNYTPGAEPHDPSAQNERRRHARFQLPTLAYVELDRSNGGIILNLSEGGLSVQAAISLMDDTLPGVRFQLGPSKEWIETAADVVWTGRDRKLVGLKFVGLTSDARLRLRNWIAGDSVPDEPSEEAAFPEELKDEPVAEALPDSSWANDSFQAEPEPVQDTHPDAASFSEASFAGSLPLEDDEEEKFTWSPETGFVRVTRDSLRNKSISPAAHSAGPHEKFDEPPKPAEPKSNLVWRPDTGFVHKWDDETRHRSGDAPPPDPPIPWQPQEPQSIDLTDRTGPGWRPEPPGEPSPSREVFRTRMHLVERPGAAADTPDADRSQLRAHDLLEQHLRDAHKQAAENVYDTEQKAVTDSPRAHETLPLNYPADKGQPRVGPRQFPFKPALTSPSQPKLRTKRGSEFARALPVVALAVPALLVGWLLGHGSISHDSSTSNSPTTESQMAPVETAGMHTSIAPQVPDLEIVDADRQSWTIPFQAATDDSTQVSHQHQSRTPATETRSLRQPRELGTLSTESDSDANNAPPTAQDQAPVAVVSSTTHSLSSTQAPAPSEPNANGSATAQQAERIPQPPSPVDGVQRGILIHRVEPIYPPEAERDGLEGDVRLRITVGSDGSVRFVQLVSGPRALAQAAIDAVQQWRFSPTLVNGKPVEAAGNVTLSFHLAYPRGGDSPDQ